MTARIHPAPELRDVHFPKYQQAIKTMHAEGLYDMTTGWLPASRARINELMAGKSETMNDDLAA